MRTPGVSKESGSLTVAATLGPRGVPLQGGLLRRLLHCSPHPLPELPGVGLRGNGETLVVRILRLRGGMLPLPLSSLPDVA